MIRFFVFIFIFQLSSAYAQIAEIFYVKGNVRVIQGEKNGIPAQKGMKLNEGDEIETQADSIAVVSFLGASKIKVDPNSKLTIEDHKPKSQQDQKTFTRFYLQWGAAVIDFFNEKKEHELEIKTRQAAMAVRGTNFFVGYGDGEEGGDVYTLVNEGKVSALNYEKDDYENIPTGKGILVDKDGGISKPEKFEWAKNLNFKTRPGAKGFLKSGFKNSDIRKRRLERRKQLLTKLKQRKKKSFKKLGEFKSWVNNRDRIKKKMQQRKKMRQQRMQKMKQRRQQMRQNRKNRNRKQIKKLRDRFRQ